MLWTATHLDLWAGLGNIAVAAVVRNGSRYGRRSGSPRLRNSCSINWISPCPFRAGGRLALVGKNLRESRAAALPASGLALDQPIVPSGDGTSNSSSLTGGHHVVPGQGGGSILSKKNHLSYQTRSSQSGRELLLTALFGRKTKPHEMWERVTALTLISRGFRHRPD